MVKTHTVPEVYQNKTISCRRNFTLFTAISLKQCLAINSTMAIKHIFYPIVLPAYSTEILLVYHYFPISPIECRRQLYCTKILSIRAYKQGFQVTMFVLVMPLGPNDTELSSQHYQRECLIPYSIIYVPDYFGYYRHTTDYITATARKQ